MIKWFGNNIFCKRKMKYFPWKKDQQNVSLNCHLWYFSSIYFHSLLFAQAIIILQNRNIVDSCLLCLSFYLHVMKVLSSKPLNFRSAQILTYNFLFKQHYTTQNEIHRKQGRHVKSNNRTPFPIFIANYGYRISNN